jgi:hypothetical protein
VQFVGADDGVVEEALEHMAHLDNETVNQYLCEVCRTVTYLTEKGAFDAGWDYPPFLGTWGVVSPRTCGNCGIEGTAYWHVLTKGGDDMPENHLDTIRRILAEPISTN